MDSAVRPGGLGVMWWYGHVRFSDNGVDGVSWGELATVRWVL